MKISNGGILQHAMFGGSHGEMKILWMSSDDKQITMMSMISEEK